VTPKRPITGETRQYRFQGQATSICLFSLRTPYSSSKVKNINLLLMRIIISDRIAAQTVHVTCLQRYQVNERTLKSKRDKKNAQTNKYLHTNTRILTHAHARARAHTHTRVCTQCQQKLTATSSLATLRNVPRTQYALPRCTATDRR
jgi:hypothetical protein